MSESNDTNGPPADRLQRWKVAAGAGLQRLRGRRAAWVLGTVAVVLVGGGGFAVAQGWKHHGPGMGGIGMMCGPQRSWMIQRVEGRIEKELTFTAEQQPLWQMVKEGIGRGEAKADETCASLAKLGPPEQATPPEHLARMEAVLRSSLEVLGEVRPPLDRLYASLTPEQRQKIETLLPGPGRHRWGPEGHGPRNGGPDDQQQRGEIPDQDGDQPG
jgi:hypothetical protein